MAQTPAQQQAEKTYQKLLNQYTRGGAKALSPTQERELAAFRKQNKLDGGISILGGGADGSLSQAMKIAQAFGELSAKAAESANKQRLSIAKGNIQAGEALLDREATTQRREIAQSLEQHQGASAASAAFRGVSGRSTEQGQIADTYQAAQQAAVVRANRATQSAALRAANQVQLEDTALAGLRGGAEGFNIGMSLLQTLSQNASVGKNGVVSIPGIDLSSLFR